VILHRITTTNFRNLRPGAIEFHPSVNLVVGNNGQGKTNLLEAVYFLATTKSFRTARSAALFRFNATDLFVSGALEREAIMRTLSVGLDWSERRTRALAINQERVTLSQYISAISVFAYSSARLEAVRGNPEERRRFLDRGIASLEPGYLDDLTRYARVLRQRNALLLRIATGDAGAASLEAWNDEFVAAALAIQNARAAYTEKLAATFRTIVAEYGYHVSNVGLTHVGVGGERELREEIARMRRSEIRARTSLLGPQRDTLEFVVDGRPAHEVLSGGELKMIVLFLKFAKLALFRERFGESPIFVLDDLDAELDVEILQKLLLRLPGETQVFATSAKEAFLAPLAASPHRSLLIENGQVSRANDFP
jgi:DNA replication and repair protein RecF